MRIATLSFVGNEEDIIEVFVRYNLQHVDHMVIVDHNSTDNTVQILNQLQEEGLSIEIFSEDTIDHRQADSLTEHMHQLAQNNPFDWYLPIDADEFITLPPGKKLTECLGALPHNAPSILHWFTYIPTSADNTTEENILNRLQYRLVARHTEMSKVIIPQSLAKDSTVLIAQGNHHVYRLVKGNHTPFPASPTHQLALAHFPVRSAYQLKKKVLIGWPRNQARPHKHADEAFHWHELFDRAIAGDTFTLTDLQQIILSYSQKSQRTEKPDVLFDPLPAPELRYTHLVADKQDDTNQLLHSVAQIAGQLAEELCITRQAYHEIKRHLEADTPVRELLQHVITSKSWRWTSPIRKFEAALKGKPVHDIVIPTMSAKKTLEKKRVNKPKLQSNSPPPGTSYFAWSEPLPTPPGHHNNRILVVIPTAGNSLQELTATLDSLEAHSGSCQLRFVVVVCPATPTKKQVLEASLANRVDLIFLPAPFSFPQSINAGLNARRAEDFVLIHNDDCRYTTGNLHDLVTTLTERRLACIGPWIEQLQDDGVELGSKRGTGFSYLHTPVPAISVLWSASWLNRIGQLDEAFAQYGLEEADLSLRARRRGALWGRVDSVVAEHDNHATFGLEAADFHSPAHQHNFQVWQQKYPHVHSWGGSNHWRPLPGIHVIYTVENQWNIEQKLQQCCQALEGFRFIIHCFCHQGVEAVQHTLSQIQGPDWFAVHTTSPEQPLSEQHAAALQISPSLTQSYPVVLFMNSKEQIQADALCAAYPVMRDNQYACAYSADTPQVAWPSLHQIFVHQSLLRNMSYDNHAQLLGQWATKGVYPQLIYTAQHAPTT